MKFWLKKGSVVTRDREKAADIWMLGSNNTWFIAETNYGKFFKTKTLEFHSYQNIK